MVRYGPSLSKLLRQTDSHQFSQKTAVQIGIQLIDRLQALHNIGYIHCDLKLQNLLIETDDVTSLESSSIVLIDFGYSDRYLDKE